MASVRPRRRPSPIAPPRLPRELAGVPLDAVRGFGPATETPLEAAVRAYCERPSNAAA